MAALTPDLTAEIIRHRLGLADGSHAARILFLIPEALKLTGRKIAANPNLRHLLLTDPAEAVEELDADGKIDLTELYDEHQILHEYLDCGEILVENETYPLQMVSLTRANLPQYLGNSYPFGYVKGNFLYVKDGVEGAEVSFAVPKFPADLSEMPESEEVQAYFIAKMVELVVGQDAAEDGEK